MSDLAIPIPDEIIGTIIEAVTARMLAARQDDGWPEWMSIQTAAKYLDVSPERITKLYASGSLPHLPGRSWLPRVL